MSSENKYLSILGGGSSWTRLGIVLAVSATIVTVATRAENELSQKFHNHGEGPY